MHYIFSTLVFLLWIPSSVITPIDKTAMFNSIPIIDLNPLFSGEINDLQQVATELYEAYSTVGFGLLINHRIPPQITGQIFSASEEFHALAEEEKLRIKYQRYLRGYLPLNISTLKDSELGAAKKPNQSESFILLNESDAEDHHGSVFAGKNVWPIQLPNFQTQVMDYYRALETLSHRLIQAFAVGLNLPVDYLDRYFTDPNIILRMLHYPPVSASSSENVYGSAPHTDYGCLTLLAQDDTGGLQVKTAEDKWLDVPCLADSLVLNTGQMMAIWSNGRLKATPHRVITNGAKHRYSVPFFYNCNLDTYVEPLPGMVSASHPLNVEAVVYGEHLEKIIRVNYLF